MRQSELCRLLNSTPLGEVTSERQIYRLRLRFGRHIGDGQYVDLLRLTAKLTESRHAQKPEPKGDPYEKLKERARARNKAIALAGRDIGELPGIANPERKERASVDFRFFCESYFPLTFHLPWSPDHLKVIEKIEQAVLRGGLFAMAMPRGSGKSTISECACIWSVLYGHREFVVLIGASEVHAEEMLDSIKMELDGNDLLLEDFPEVIYPIQRLDGIANRCSGQLYKGERTHIAWTSKEIVLPTIAGSKASGAIIKVAGITGRIRGMKYKRADGMTVRPSLVVLDDPQTDESARSLSQCATRESILAGAVLGLAGPGKKISGIMPCTVIRPGDMADNILDRDRHPEWNGERTKMVYSFPTNERLWQRYAEIRADSLRREHLGEEATEFYRANREAMDEGAAVAWPERFNHDELSAIQHAMNLKLQDEAAFFAEYQNEPIVVRAESEGLLTADEIASKTNGLKRGCVPLSATMLTGFIDVQQKALFWMVCAFAEDFTGAIVDYGTYPEQHRHYFTLASLTETIQSKHASGGIEAAITAALATLETQLMSREWEREDGTVMHIDRLLIDSGWGEHTELVYEHCRRSQYSANVRPSKGRSVTSSSKPIDEWERQAGMKVGPGWAERAIPNMQRARLIHYDTNKWKSFAQARLSTPVGDRTSLTLFGRDPHQHILLADHLTSEIRDRKTSERTGRTVEEWRLPAHRPDNHWLDCLVGCCVAASYQGASTITKTQAAKAKERKTLAEIASGIPSRA